jgi:ADP-ribosylglycohydrolase
MAFREGADYAALTHGQPTAYYAAGFFAEIIAQIIEGKSLQDAVELSIEQLTAFDDHKNLLQCMEKALELFILQTPERDSISQLGEGVTAAEVLAIGVFCSLKHVSEFPEGVRASVNHSGTSTSTGLVTGAILGALLGHEAIPENWTVQVENAQEIAETAEDMHKVFKQGERISFEKYSLE